MIINNMLLVLDCNPPEAAHHWNSKNRIFSIHYSDKAGFLSLTLLVIKVLIKYLYVFTSIDVCKD